jgi:glycosyltransferase involved in cell wall biosynthesis
MSREARYSQLSMAVLTEMDAWSASTRYRALQHVPRLRSLMGRVDVSTPGDMIGRRPGRAGQVLYFAAHAGRYARRALALRNLVGCYDALFVQRGLYVIGPGLIADPVLRYEGRVVLDLDDAVFELRPSLAARGAFARWLYGPQQTLALLRRADEVVVSTPALAEMLPSGTIEPTILPTLPDPGQYPIVEQRDGQPVVVGWAGTVGGLGFLDPLREVFARLDREGLTRLEVVSSRPWRGPASFRAWRLDEETSVFGDFAIGIMPLPDTPYTRAKAGFKLLQYMAAGLPVVASPVGVNRDLLQRSGAGLLAEHPAEWEAALRELAASIELRRELGRRGRSFVERYADLDNQARTLAALVAGVDLAPAGVRQTGEGERGTRGR